MTDFSPLDSALYESTPEKIAASLRYLRKADAVMAALMPLSASTQAPPVGVLMKEPYTCKYCGQPSWLDPADQTPPVDYCHPSDHGDPDETNLSPPTFRAANKS